MKTLILAAGYGTRLYPLIKNTAKPLLQVNGKPIIDYQLEKLKPLSGLDEVIVVTNEKYYKVFGEWAKKSKIVPAKITVLNDGTTSPETRLGAIGDINFALKKANIHDDLLVIGGDNIFDYTIDDFVVFANAKAPSVSLGLYDIGSRDKAKIFGVAKIDKEDRIISFEEKPSVPQSSLIAMCMYYFPKASLHLMDDYFASSQKADAAGNYIKWLHQLQPVYGFTFEGRWYDIGSIETYQEAQKHFRS